MPLKKIISKKILMNETDATGGIYFTSALRIAQEVFEECLLDKFERLHPALNKWGVLIPIRVVQGDFLKPLQLSDEVRISLEASLIKERSFEITTTWENKGALCFISKIVHVCVKKTTFEPCPLPEELRNFLAS